MDIDQAGKFPGLAASLPPSDTTNAAHSGGVFASGASSARAADEVAGASTRVGIVAAGNHAIDDGGVVADGVLKESGSS